MPMCGEARRTSTGGSQPSLAGSCPTDLRFGFAGTVTRGILVRSSADGKVEIQIRDLDQTVFGNPAHDLIRLGLSLATAARGSDLPGVTTALMVEHMIEGYEDSMKSGKVRKSAQFLQGATANRNGAQAVGKARMAAPGPRAD